MILNNESPQPLGALPTGASAEIVGFEVTREHLDFLIRLQEVGFILGETVEVLGRAPLGRDPISIRVKDGVYAMRRGDADLILVRTSGKRTAGSL
jgi:ferrous iron transport protein A